MEITDKSATEVSDIRSRVTFAVSEIVKRFGHYEAFGLKPEARLYLLVSRETRRNRSAVSERKSGNCRAVRAVARKCRHSIQSSSSIILFSLFQRDPRRGITP